MAAGSEALNAVKATEPTQWLVPSSDLSAKSRAALKNLFSSLRPFTPKSPFDELLVEGFDAEQIWQQIDIQSQPLISSLRRELKRYEKNPAAIRTLKVVVDGEEKVLQPQNESDEEDEDDDDVDELEVPGEGEDDEEEVEEEEDDDDVEENEEDDEEEKVEEEDEEEEEGGEGNNEIEDGFFNAKELSKFLKDAEVDYENDKEDEAQELMNLGEAEDAGEGKDARYEDFFGKKDLSTHEKELLKRKAVIEQIESTMMGDKTWTMQGEVTAAKRPQNSALEVDLDFEHNVMPAPPITEEVTVAVEDMIRKRIEQELFDDVRRAPTLPTKAPRERKEMDENKSKKGLAEDYEQEYIQKINPDSGLLSSRDKQKNEAEMLFKKLCLKLDALSHFHFTPKPVIEDMSIQDNVPALAMEEIAPVAVSDAAMLAPEEVYSGKGDIKDEAELTQAERKRRRANKKRKFKAETAKKMAKKPREDKIDSIETI